MVPTGSYLIPRHDHDTSATLTTSASSDGFSATQLCTDTEGIYASNDDELSVASHERSHLAPESSSAYSPSTSSTAPLEADRCVLSQEPYDILVKEAYMEVNPTRSISPETLRSGSDMSRTRSISSSHSSHSLLLPQSPSAYRSSLNSDSRTHITVSSPSASTSASTPPLLRTANNMSSREKKRLVRSHRKLSYILGETPVLSTTIGSSDVSLDMIDEKDADPGRTGEPSAGCRRTTVPVARHDFNDQRSSPQVYHAPRMRRASSPVPTRSPPVLRIDTAITPKSGFPRRHTSEAGGDACSIISTTTTTTLVDTHRSRARSHSHTRRSPLSPVSAQSFLSSEGEVERAKEKKRVKLAKLSRHLGENVPSELVFPVVLPRTTPKRISPSDSPTITEMGPDDQKGQTVVTWSTNTAKTLAPEKQSGNVYAPPRRSSLIKRRKRISLSLDFHRRRSAQQIGMPALQAQILESREDYNDTNPKLSVEKDHREEDKNKLQDAADDHDDFGQTQAPWNDRQRLMNVRRAQKMSRVFGSPPPSALLQKTNIRALSVLDEDVESVRRLKRHSFHSVISAVSVQTERTAVAQEDMLRHPNPQREEPVHQNHDGKPSLKKSPPSPPKTHKRGHSLTDVPPTPPPFSRYFQTPVMSTRASTSTATSSSVPRTPSPTVSGLPIGSPMPLAGCPARQRHRHRHSPSSPSALSTTSSSANHSLLSPRSPQSLSSIGSPSCVAEKLKALDPVSSPHGSGAESFAVRRQRATKLTRFFGVDYGELFPASASTPSFKLDTDLESPVSPSMRTSSQIDITFERKGTIGKAASRTRMPLSLRPILNCAISDHARGCTRVDPDAAMKSPLEGVSVVVQRNVWHDDEPVPSVPSAREAYAFLKRIGSCEDVNVRKRSGEGAGDASVTLGRSKKDPSMLEVMEKLRELRR